MSWRPAAQLRCGICDEPITADDQWSTVDDERCHVACINDDAPCVGPLEMPTVCRECGSALAVEDEVAACCECCGFPL